MSSKRNALIDQDANVTLFNPMTTVIHGAPTIEAAVNALLQAAPPSTVKTVFILIDPGFENCLRPVEAVQKAGYTDVEPIEPHQKYLSSIILNVPLNQTVGTAVFVFNGSVVQVAEGNVDSVTVLRKRELGWQVVRLCQDIYTALAEFPSVKEVIVTEATSAEMALVRAVFSGLKLHVTEGPLSKSAASPLPNLIRNNVKESNILPFCSYDLLVKFGNKCEKIDLTDVPPFSIVKEIDVGNVSKVEIRAFEEDEDDYPLVKDFNFKSATFRTVLITVTVDKTLLPQVSLKTIATRESKAITVPPAVLSPSSIPNGHNPDMVFLANLFQGSFIMSKIQQNQVIDKADVATVDEAIAFMKTRTSKSLTSVVFFQYNQQTTVSLQTFRDKCRDAGLLDVRFLPYLSAGISLIFERIQIPIDNGQFVALLNPSMFYIVTRVGGNLKMHKGGLLEDFNVNRCTVSKVIVADAFGRFNKSTFNKLQKKFQSHVHLVTTDLHNIDSFLPQLLWNSVDEMAANKYVFNFCDFVIDIGGESLFTLYKEFPFTMTADVAVFGTTLEVNLFNDEFVELLKKFTLQRGTRRVRIVVNAESACDITVTMVDVAKPAVKETIDAEQSLPTRDTAVRKKKSRSERRRQARRNALQNGTSDGPSKATEVPTSHDDDVATAGSKTTLPEELSQLQLDPPPTTVLTFTSDNRVLIKADETYTGVTQLLAYVRLEAGAAPIVGQQAFDALKTHPKSVFYGITRLLAIDFDPAHPDPSWTFKTSRDADGKLLIHGGDDIVTLPIVLFGLVVNSTLLYIREHQKSEVTELCIRLPTGSTISNAELKSVAQRIGIKLVLLVD
uniref:Guanylate cyclase n=1 Tax=Panagrellus redivivus TaxID=6233 RepID=A0A7E4ZTY6_PANRE